MRTLLIIVLAVVIIILANLVFRSIKDPLEYEKLKKDKGTLVTQRLKDIRNAQNAYKNTNGKYTTDFDKLINFMENGFVKTIKAEGAMKDEWLEKGIDEKKAVKRGLIKRDTIKVLAKETIFKNIKYPFRDIKYIPETNLQFEIAKKEIKPTESSTNMVEVLEIKAPIEKVLKDLISEYKESYNTDLAEYKRLNKYKGWKIGSLEEANDLKGSWE